MTVTDALKLARRWWWIILMCPVVAALSAYFVSSALTPIYRATAILLVQQSQTPGSPNYQDLLAAQQQTGTYSRLVTMRPVLTEAATKLGLSGPDDISDNVSVSSVQDTQLVTLAVSDPNPKRAANIANTIADVFIEQTKAKQAAITGTSMNEIQESLDQAKQQVDDTSAQIVALEAMPEGKSNNQTEIADLQRQLSQVQATYGSLLEVQQQMAIARLQVGAQISVVERAIAPASPVSPRTTRNTTLGGVLGLMIALGLVALLGYFDNTVKSSDDLRALTGSGALGGIPATAHLDTHTILNQSRSAATERFRALRTHLQFEIADKNIKTIAISSSRPGDGKTTIAANLAMVAAQGGQRVILVDADLRNPRLHRQFNGLSSRAGLTDLLRGSDNSVRDLLQQTGVPGLRVLTSGPLPANPPDTLSSPRMPEVIKQLEAEAELVLFDTPPLAVSDPFIIAGIADGVLLVAWSGRTRKHEISTALERIGRSGTPVIGIILNSVDLDGEGSYYAYRSYYDTHTEPPSNPPSDTAEPAPAPAQKQ